MIRAGDLVIPIDEREFLFSSPEKAEDESEPIDMIWGNEDVGIVVKILQFDPQRDYHYVCVVVSEVVGWTFSDYIRVVHENKA